VAHLPGLSSSFPPDLHRIVTNDPEQKLNCDRQSGQTTIKQGRGTKDGSHAPPKGRKSLRKAAVVPVTRFRGPANPRGAYQSASSRNGRASAGGGRRPPARNRSPVAAKWGGLNPNWKSAPAGGDCEAIPSQPEEGRARRKWGPYLRRAGGRGNEEAPKRDEAAARRRRRG